jgi:hypothetical protein
LFQALITFCSVIFIVKATERPEYVMLNKLSDNMEIRKYLASKWACTTQTNGESSMFVQLFNYISGIKSNKIILVFNLRYFLLLIKWSIKI